MDTGKTTSRRSVRLSRVRSPTRGAIRGAPRVRRWVELTHDAHRHGQNSFSSNGASAAWRVFQT